MNADGTTPSANDSGWPCAGRRITDQDQEEIMSRVAVVTGGTRGIGEAISVALKAARLQGGGELCR